MKNRSIHYTRTIPALLIALGLASLTGIAACAEPAMPAATGGETRVLVKLARAQTDPNAIARQASEVAALPVRYVAATSAQWHALVHA